MVKKGLWGIGISRRLSEQWTTLGAIPMWETNRWRRRAISPWHADCQLAQKRRCK